MSRRIISDLDSELEIAIGYDNPLDTFFVQVIRLASADQPEADDETLLWHGTSYQEIQQIAEIERILRPYSVFTPAMHELLESDRQAERGDPTEFQRNMLDFISKNWF